MTAIRSLIIATAAALVFSVQAEEPAKKPTPISPQEVVDAALAGKIEFVEKALAQGYKVDTRNPEKRTALMFAAFNGHTAVIKKLIDAGADVNAQDATGSTALMFASSGPFPKAVELLLDSGAKINTIDSNEHFTALMWAAAEGQAEVVELLLKHKADATLKDVDGDTAESFAAQKGHTAIVKILRGTTQQTLTPKKDKIIISSGTGFFISRNGYLLTNSHVINGAKKITVVYGKKELAAKLIDEDTKNDIALLKVDAQTPFLELSSKAGELGSKVFVTGFPNPSIQGNKVKYTEGTISSTAGMNDDPRVYQISVPVQPGNSGGPLVDDDGKVTGIIVSKLDDVYSFQQSGSIPQNVNYAVKSLYIKAFLSSIEPFSASNNKETSALTHLDRAVQSTVLIRAQQ